MEELAIPVVVVVNVTLKKDVDTGSINLKTSKF